MILCCGDINIDIALEVLDIPKEDEELPIQTLDISPGGSVANFAVSMARLGANIGIVGSIGNDTNGNLIREQFKKENIDMTLLNLDKENSTGTAVILIDHSKNRRILTYRGANGTCNMKFVNSKLIKKCSHFHFSSPHYSFLENFPFSQFENITFSIDAGNLLCTAKPDLLKKCLPYMTFLFINNIELSNLYPNTPLNNQLVTKLGCQYIVHKNGAQGSTIWSANDHIIIPAFSTKTIDTTGAGDAYAGGFIYQYTQGVSLKESGVFASAVGALNVQSLGAQVGLPTRQQVTEFILSQGAVDGKN